MAKNILYVLNEHFLKLYVGVNILNNNIIHDDRSSYSALFTNKMLVLYAETSYK